MQSLKKAEFISYLAACLLGVISHFVYEWSGNNLLVGLFFPINESTWEHLKLVYFPILLVSVLEYYIFSLQNPNFFCIKFQSALLGMIATIVLFYTYQGVLGRNVDWINIAIYFLAMAIAYKYSYQTLNQKKAPMNNSTLCILLGSLLIILFMIFTVYPPDIGLFAAP